MLTFEVIVFSPVGNTAGTAAFMETEFTLAPAA